MARQEEKQQQQQQQTDSPNDRITILRTNGDREEIGNNSTITSQKVLKDLQ